MKSKLVLSFLLIGWMGIIFYFSNQPADVSSGMSNPFVDGFLELGTRFSLISDPEAAREIVIFVVRKLAHFSVYLILGILMGLTLSRCSFPHWFFFAVLFCMVYAASDEFHQFFIVGRSCEVRDVLIDSMGSFLGILFVSWFGRRKSFMKKRSRTIKLSS